ncbi:MAG: bifunctional 2-C-methyl-D-erythritol 4-phosphate cytidylyltransferase/2-C-methyl-D-erythritol 2,4-cyclodiphosphate synthase [Parasphingorhabdus sp.]
MTRRPKSSTETHALIVAAGIGVRSGLDLPKQFQALDGKPMVRHSAEQFLAHNRIAKLWIVTGADQNQLLADSMEGLPSYLSVTGGDTRQESVVNGLLAIEKAGGCDRILIHDAARPHLDGAIIDSLCDTLEDSAGAIPVLPVVDTIVEEDKNYCGETLSRDRLKRVQTPQAFDFDMLLAAHQNHQGELTATDDAQIFRAAGHQVALVKGDEKLKKYTTNDDFKKQEKVTTIRTGMGFDVHQLGAGEELWLGGIKIDHEKGLIGHSDADVLLHALTDALLGTVGGGDIGDHFPPSEAKWKNVASEKFVKFAAQFITEKGGSINNVDMTLMCEAPKIKPHREKIRLNVARLLDISPNQVSVKATTTEGLGFTGRREGIAAQAIATVSLTGNQK